MTVINSDTDTATLRGGPKPHFGGKGRIAPFIVDHLARAKLYIEPFFGGGSVFYALPQGLYQREVINDLDDSVVTFFRVLRDRCEELIHVCSLSPFARSEFEACLPHSDDPLEEARRVWVRSRQAFPGKVRTVGGWARYAGADVPSWGPQKTESKLAALMAYAARLRNAQIDCIDAVSVVDKWAHAGSMVYLDPPYAADARKSKDVYEHEMSDDDHRRLAVAVRDAVERGAHVALSGYPSKLYDDLYGGWRQVEVAVRMTGRRNLTEGDRTEVMWLSYPVEMELSYVAPINDGPLFGAR